MSDASKKLSCNGNACPTCGKCCDWCFTGDTSTGAWISKYESWNNDDWMRWRRNRTWNLYQRKDGTICTSVSRGPGNTYDDPIFGGHKVVHTVNFFADMTIRASHDFLFVGDHAPADQRIVSSISDLCVCNLDNK